MTDTKRCDVLEPASHECDESGRVRTSVSRTSVAPADKWNVRKSDYRYRPSAVVIDTLPTGYYTVEFDRNSNEYYLHAKNIAKVSKIYGFDEEFISRCLTTYSYTSNNLGILLYGLKGTGKSVCAMQICSRSQLPVLVLQKADEGALKFISSINQDLCVLVDEYEKVFKDREHLLLSIMDGALDTSYRRMFLFTSNTLAINPYMIERPGRIRYVRQYGNLCEQTTREIVTDIIVDHNSINNIADTTVTIDKIAATIDKIVNFIGTLKTITVDIVKTVAFEYKLYNCELEEMESYLNIKPQNKTYSLEFVRGFCVPYSDFESFDYDIMCTKDGWRDEIVRGDYKNISNDIREYKPSVLAFTDINIKFKHHGSIYKKRDWYWGVIAAFNKSSIFINIQVEQEEEVINTVQEFKYTLLPFKHENWK